MNAKILVVDDELLLRDVLFDYLSRQGYEVLMASNGEKALEIAQNNRFHLALVDIKMPGISGLDVTAKLKELYPQIIVIIMTGYPSLNTAISAIKLGATEYIVKPFRLDELNRIIAKNLSSLDTEYENLKLKERIKELEKQLGVDGNEPEQQEDSLHGDVPEEQLRSRGTYGLDPAAASEKYRNQTSSAKKQNMDDQLLRLDRMLADHIITPEEYEKKKAEILKEQYA